MENPPFCWYLPGKKHGIFDGLVYRRVVCFHKNAGDASVDSEDVLMIFTVQIHPSPGRFTKKNQPISNIVIRMMPMAHLLPKPGNFMKFPLKIIEMKYIYISSFFFTARRSLAVRATRCDD